jgi:ankyrin repeat protein
VSLLPYFPYAADVWRLSTQRTEGSVTKMSAELAHLLREISHVRHHLEENAEYTPPSSDPSLPSYEAVTHYQDVRKNLESCVKSAERVWSTASNAFASSTVHGSIDGLSVAGEPLSARNKAEISQWVSESSNDARDTHPADDSMSSESMSIQTYERESYNESLLSVTDDVELRDDYFFNPAEEMCHIERCQEESAACMEAEDYSAAEEVQKEAMRYLERRHARQGTRFENKDEMLEVLTGIYYKQNKLEKAAKILYVLAQAEESPPDKPWKWQHRLAEVYLELNRLERALKWCAAAKRGREKEHGTNDPLFYQSIALTARISELKGDTRIVRTLKKLYPDAFVAQQYEEKRRESVALLKENGFDSASDDWDPAKAVNWAASTGQVHALKHLLEETENDSLACQRLETMALTSAASSGKMAVLEMLFKRTVCIDVTNSEGSTPLLLAVQNGHEGVVRLLLEKEANVEARDRLRRRTALHLAQCRSMNEEITRMLIQKGADVNAKDRSKQRPLHVAAEKGEDKAAEILLQNGADIHARDDSSTTALHLAICRKQLPVVALLFDYGAKGDLALVGIAKKESNTKISTLVEEKVKQQEKERKKKLKEIQEQEKEKKKKLKEIQEQEKESKKQSKNRKPSSGVVPLLSRWQTT